MGRASEAIRTMAWLCLALGASACAAVFGFDALHDAEADAGRLAADSATDAAGPEAGVICPPLTLPPAPGLGAGGPGAGADLAFAMSAFRIAPDVGLNLDNVCTTSLAQSACGLDDEADLVFVGDEDAGVDVSGNRALQAAAGFLTASRPANIEGAIAYGYSNFLVVLQGWNREPDDGVVSIVTYASRGLEGPPGTGSIDRRAPDPSDPNERWTWRLKAVTTGYVAKNRLVARFEQPVSFLVATQIAGPARPPAPGLRLEQDAGTDAGTLGADDERPLTVTLQNAYVLADVVLVGDDYELQNGILAGRLRAEPFIDEAVRIRNLGETGFPRPFCVGGQNSVEFIFKGLCQTRDVRADVQAEAGSCDAVSIGVAFGGRRTALGAEDTAVLTDPCPDFPKADCRDERPQIPDPAPPPTDGDAAVDSD